MFLSPVVKSFFRSILEQRVAFFSGWEGAWGMGVGGSVRCRCFPLAQSEPRLLALYEWLHAAANPSGPVGSRPAGVARGGHFDTECAS